MLDKFSSLSHAHVLMWRHPTQTQISLAGFAEFGSQQITRRLLQSSASAGVSLSLAPPNAPPPQQPDAAPARSRRVKKDVEIVVAAVVGLLLLGGGVFCVLCVLCRCVIWVPVFVRVGVKTMHA